MQPEKQETPITADELRKNTREAFSALSSAISKLSDGIIAVNDNNNTELKKEMTASLDSEKKRIDGLLQRVATIEENNASFKETVKSELFASIKTDIETMKSQTATAIAEMKNAKNEMALFKTEMNNQMQQEKAKIAKFFSGINSLLGQI